MEITQVILINFCTHKNYRISQLIVVIFHKIKQNGKSDDDDAVYKLCSQRYKVQTVKVTL